MIVGQGDHRYQVAEGWGQLPEGWTFAQIAGVAVDSQDRVFVFHRGKHPVIVFDREGRVVTTWGDEFLVHAHGICIDANDFVYLVDSKPHVVYKCTPDGQIVLTLGTPGRPGQDGAPFNVPTDVAVAPWGDVYVSDGYGATRVHRFAADGTLLQSWGTRGEGPGQFALPHSVWVDPRERVIVSDRENHRLQLFTPDGRYLTEWTGFNLPTDLFVDREGTLYVSELRHRLSIQDLDGNLLARWGGEPSATPGNFVAPHGVWVDSHGDLYVSEVLEGKRIQKFVRLRG